MTLLGAQAGGRKTMANKKSAARKSKKRANKQRSKKSNTMRMAQPNAGAGKLMRQICSITDPFCNAAVGSKYPDAAALKTLPWDVEYFIDLNANASGQAALFLGPDPAWAYTFAQTYSSGTIVATTQPGYALPAWSNWSSVTGVLWRCVSFGVEIQSQSSAMNNSGSMGILAIPAAAGQYTLVGTDFSASTYATNVRESCSSNQKLAGISNSDAVISKTFKANNTPTANVFYSGGNDILVAYIAGAEPSKGSIRCRLVYHYELTFSSGSVFNQIATPAALENTTAQTGSNFVKRAVDQVVVGGAKEVERRVMNAASSFGTMLIRNAAGAVGGAIGGYFGGPGGASAGYGIGNGAMGMIMDVD